MDRPESGFARLRVLAQLTSPVRERDYAPKALDFVLLLLLTGSFGLLITCHVALVVGLLAMKPHWRGLLALLIPPLAPYWGWEERMRVRAALWVFSLCAYGISLIASAL